MGIGEVGNSVLQSSCLRKTAKVSEISKMGLAFSIGFPFVRHLHSPCLTMALSLRTNFLVAITSATRVPEIAALGFKEPEVASRFHMTQEITLPLFLPENSQNRNPLNMGYSLKAYVDATAELRKSDHSSSILMVLGRA